MKTLLKESIKKNIHYLLILLISMGMMAASTIILSYEFGILIDKISLCQDNNWIRQLLWILVMLVVIDIIKNECKDKIVIMISHDEEVFGISNEIIDVSAYNQVK